MFTTAADHDVRISSALFARLATAFGLVVLADWLFFGRPIGVSMAIFLGAIGIVAIAGSNRRRSRRIQIATGAAFAASLVALTEDISLLSVAFGVPTTALFVTAQRLDPLSDWRQYLLGTLTLPLRGPAEFALDAMDVSEQVSKTRFRRVSVEQLLAWVVPAGLSLVFIALFVSANPIIEQGVWRLDISAVLRALDPQRIGFWLLIVVAIWPIVSRRFVCSYVRAPLIPAPAAPSRVWTQLLGEGSIARSLIMFNALFALQTGLDLAYLWGGFSLPNGMTYAQYAHRGAYPLVVTALLAAAFALVAMRPNGPAEHSRLIRPLVLLFVVQNVMLVMSSIFRLDLYVATFSLTYLRLAAFIWMLLVALGLVLMIAQIVLRKTTGWLLAANAGVLGAVLYACCFLNAASLIADYNIRHSREVDANGAVLDLAYLVSLGPQALPAIEAHLDDLPQLRVVAWDLRQTQKRLAWSDWRAFGFRDWRLQRYVSATSARLPAGANGEVKKPDGG